MQREVPKVEKRERFPCGLLDAVQTTCRRVMFSPNVLPLCENTGFLHVKHRDLSTFKTEIHERRTKEGGKNIIQSVNGEDWGADRVVSTSLEPHSVSNVVPPGCEGTLLTCYPVYVPPPVCAQIYKSKSWPHLRAPVHTHAVVSNVAIFYPDIYKVQQHTHARMHKHIHMLSETYVHTHDTTPLQAYAPRYIFQTKSNSSIQQLEVSCR